MSGLFKKNPKVRAALQGKVKGAGGEMVERGSRQFTGMDGRNVQEYRDRTRQNQMDNQPRDGGPRGRRRRNMRNQRQLGAVRTPLAGADMR